MFRSIKTILLGLLAALFVTAATFLAIDGNLARLTGWYHYRPGLPLFSKENIAQLPDVSWMRIEMLHDKIECQRDDNGVWWIISPFRDRLAPEVVQQILLFTSCSKVVDTLPLNHTTRGSMREFGVESCPYTITLKVKEGKNSYTTIARYTLGSASPWLADAEDGKSVLPTTYLRTDFYGRDKRVHVVTGNILHLFRNGLSALRDPHPLSVPQDAVHKVTIKQEGESDVVINRPSPESDWVILSPCITAASQGRVAELVSSLTRMIALRVDNPGEVKLTEKPDCTISLHAADGAELGEMTLYPPFFSEKYSQQIRYAVVKGRPVVFTLRAAPKVARKGSYREIVKEVCKLPVLTEKAMSQVKMAIGGDVIYTGNLPLTLEKLRSSQFADIDIKDVERIYLRSRMTRHPLIVRLVPGDAASGVADSWLFTAEGKAPQEAEPEVVKQFINALRDIPVRGFLADSHPGDDPAILRSRFGLDRPIYMLVVAPRSCAYRATLFGNDMPLVRDQAPRAFLITRHTDPDTGGGMWIGMEDGGNTVYSLSTKLTGKFSLQADRWRLRNLLSFPLSALRKLTLFFQQAPLELHYDYIGESWTGTLKGEDITPQINPHRAEHYVRQLQRLRVEQWIAQDDETALHKLAKPVFSISLDLELTDYSDAAGVVIESDDAGLSGMDESELSNRENVQRLLQEDEDDATAKAMRELALAERETIKRTVTIDIAPMDNVSDKPLFYGRIRETGEMFILTYEAAQGLGASLLDM